jgi:predicted metallopeptidase
MTIDDFWMRLYGLSADLQPVSTAAWNETSKCLIEEFRKFPATTREALRGHVAVMIERLTQLYSQLQ